MDVEGVLHSGWVMSVVGIRGRVGVMGEWGYWEGWGKSGIQQD